MLKLLPLKSSKFLPSSSPFHPSPLFPLLLFSDNRLIRSFYTSQPRPCSSVNSAKPSTWRTIECGIRTSSSFADGFMRFLTAPQMTDDVIVNFMKLFGDHGRHLLQWNTGGNWLTMEMNGLYTLGKELLIFSATFLPYMEMSKLT